jgi:hypothetical protein
MLQQEMPKETRVGPQNGFDIETVQLIGNEESQSLLTIRANFAEKNFHVIILGDEF